MTWQALLDWLSDINVAQLSSTLLGTGLIGYLLKMRIDRSLARHAATLQRGVNLHQVQIGHLCSLYGALMDAASNSAWEAAGARMTNDPSEAAIVRAFKESLSTAHREYVGCCLLLPKSATDQVEAFFRKTLEFRIQLGAAETTPPGLEHAKQFTEAQRIARDEIPEILDAIAVTGRRLIGSDRWA